MKPVLSLATYRTYEAMEIVRYEKETMAGGITGRQLRSTWGSMGNFWELLGESKEEALVQSSLTFT